MILPDFCLIMCGTGEMNERIDALEVDADHVVPLLFGHFFDGQIFEVPDASVGNDDVEAAEARDGVIDEFLVGIVAADIGLEGFDARAVLPGFLLNQLRRLLSPCCR